MDYEKDYLKETTPAGARKEAWVPEDDDGADWCLGKMREKEEEIQRITCFVEAKMNSLEEYLDKRTRSLKEDHAHLSAMLQAYAEERLGKTKKRSLALPNGRFGFRKLPPKFQKDEAALLEHAEKEAPTCVKTKKTVDWSTLKKTCVVDGEYLISKDGEIVPGVRVEQQPDRFYAEVG